MDAAAQQVLSETVRQLAAAGLVWYALALVLAAALIIVASRYAKPGSPPPKMPDVPDDPTRPDADPWPTDPDHPGGGMGGG